MGDLYLLKKDQKQAGEEFKKAAELAPVRSMERLKYAAFMSAAGDTAETRRISTEMTRQAPDYLPGWTLLAELAFKDKKYDEALSLLENVFSRDPEYIDGRRLESRGAVGKGRHEKSGRSFGATRPDLSGLPLIKYQLARAYLKNNNMNQAKVALDQAISSNPNYADAVLLLAETNLRSGHSEIGHRTDHHLLRKKPDLRSAGSAPGRRLWRRWIGSTMPQRSFASKQGSPRKIHKPYTALGLTFRQAKRNDEARQAFEKAAELAPDNLWLVDQLVELDLLDKHFDLLGRGYVVSSKKRPIRRLPIFWKAKF